MKIVKNTPVPVPATYDLLGLEEREVKALVTVLRSVGGSPDGPRGAIEHALACFAAAGVDVMSAHYRTLYGPQAIGGKVHFADAAIEQYWQ